MSTVSLCMIAKNEEEVLERCLESIKGFPDEIIFVDTGSTDKTVELAHKYTDKIYHFEWINDFAAARNFSFSKATCDYILWLDCDDVVLPKNFEKLRALKPNLSKDIYLLPYDYCQDENGKSLSTLYRERIVRNTPKLRFRYPIHECIGLLGDTTTEQVEIVITHKRTNAGFCADLSRNIKMLESALTKPEYKNDPRIQYYLAKECVDGGQWEQAIKELHKFLDMNDGWYEDRICGQIKLAEAYLNLGKTEQAKKEALKSIEMDYRWAEPYYVLGSIAIGQNDWPQAIHWFELCRRPIPSVLSPTRPDYYTWLPNLQLCVCYNAVGDMKKAYERNKEALKYRPNDPRMVNNDRILTAALHLKKVPDKPKKLNLGSGNKRYKDYVSCDLFPGREVDEVFGLQEIPYADNTIDAIHSEHALEHLYHHEARAAIKEWVRVLKPGGELHLQIPDLEECCRKFVEAKEPRLKDWYRYTIFGAQRPLGDEPLEGQIHYTGFTMEEIKQEITNAGLVIDCATKYDGSDTPSLEIRAFKPNNGIKIGWVTIGSALEVPQYRIRTHNINRWLQSRGYASHIIDFSRASEFDVLIFDDVYRQEGFDRITQAKNMGKRVIVNVCEDWFEFNNPWYSKSLVLADMVITCSPKLTEKVKVLNNNVMDIEDAVESDFNLNCEYKERKLRVAWIGMGGNAVHAERLRPIIEKCGYELVTIHEHANATVKWDLNTWQSELIKCDIAIAPIDHTKQPCKSNNKITTYMALGLPVICSPLHAYTRLIQTGVNGFVANNDAEWEQYLTILKDPETRKRIGQAGKRTARAYHLDLIAGYWRDILIKPQIDNTVDIIIPTYDNPQYLEQCIESIKACTDVPYNIIVVDAKKEGTNFSQSLNLGIKRGKAPWVCFLNDDTIVSKGWIRPLIDQIKGNVAFCNPLSNCDKGWLHNYDLVVDGRSLLPGVHKIGSINPKSIYNFKSTSIKSFTRPWVAFFATMTSREIINKIGLLDEEFKTGSEDLDYCTRANKLGYVCSVNEASFVFHFGGVSRKAHEDENYQKHQEEDRYNNDRIRFKYDKPLVVIQTGYAWEAWGPDCKEKGLGGSEQWAVYLSEAMAKQGVRMVVFAPTGKSKEIVNDVEWYDSSEWDKFISMNHMDVCVVSRYVNFFETPIRATKKYLFVHDIFALCSQENGRDRVQEQYDKLDGIFVLSEWHKNFFADYHKVPKDKLIVFSHGLGMERFEL